MLYNNGDKVIYTRLGRLGVVVGAWYDGMTYRYYVDIGFTRWSIPQACLDTENRENAA